MRLIFLLAYREYLEWSHCTTYYSIYFALMTLIALACSSKLLLHALGARNQSASTWFALQAHTAVTFNFMIARGGCRKVTLV